jgi:NarL family two-component system response regulator LiaR
MRPIILADNQDLTKAGWLYLIQLAGCAVYNEVSDKKTLLRSCATQPEAVVIIDYTLFDFQQEDELIILQEKYPGISWIVCADTLTDAFIRRLLFTTRHCSFLLKDSSLEDLQSALKMVLHYQRFISSAISNRLLNSDHSRSNISKPSVLTATEQEILKELAMGKSTRDIAELRNISTHTVMTHRKNIFRKIEVNTVYEATRYAVKTGLVNLSDYYI